MRKAIVLSAILGLVLTASAFAENPSSKPSGKTNPGSLDMSGTQDATPSKYAFTPVRRGQLKDAEHSEFMGEAVKTKDGKEVGKLDDLLMDTKTKKVEYGVLEINETKELIPIPWSSFKASKGEVKLNLTKEQLDPMIKFNDSKDMSPDVKKVIKDMRANMGKPFAGNKEGLGITEEPAAGGGMGESKAGGGGPSGPRGDSPADRAPGFEGGK
ncbi:MAG: PRC-barrel domain-containing protein [Nitrospiraceae bacterium]